MHMSYENNFKLASSSFKTLCYHHQGVIMHMSYENNFELANSSLKIFTLKPSNLFVALACKFRETKKTHQTCLYMRGSRPIQTLDRAEYRARPIKARP